MVIAVVPVMTRVTAVTVVVSRGGLDRGDDAATERGGGGENH